MTTQVHLDAEPKGRFDLLASVPAGKGLGRLPEESKQDVPYAQGVCRLQSEGETGSEGGWKDEGKERSPSFSFRNRSFEFLGVCKDQERKQADLRLPR